MVGDFFVCDDVLVFEDLSCFIEKIIGNLDDDDSVNSVFEVEVSDFGCCLC